MMLLNFTMIAQTFKTIISAVNIKKNKSLRKAKRRCNGNINNIGIPINCFSFMVLVLCVIAHCHTDMTYWEL